MAVEPRSSKYVAEFVGTYMLVFVVGCNVLRNGSSTFAVVSIASVLMVMIYSLGSVSGGHFNPAVTVAVTLSNKMPGGWGEAFIYIIVQLVAGSLGGASYALMLGESFNLSPQAGYTWVEAGVVEVLYTCMICFVVLTTACNSKTENNQFYGLAIGYVIVAGGYGAGPISGGAFNPAVALGIDISSVSKGFGWCVPYLGYELVGASLAAIFFKLVRPGEFTMPPSQQVSVVSKLVAESLGTFYLVLTVGLNAAQGVSAGAYSIAASLMCMIYAIGNVSGGHLNPAVTVAVLLSGRQKTNPVEAAQYTLAQLFGGVLGSLTASSLIKTVHLAPQGTHTILSAAIGEVIFTFVLCYVVLCVATVQQPSKDMYGLAIGACVVVGGFAIGGISGGSLNPAVSFGLDMTSGFDKGLYGHSLTYIGSELVGGALAALIFSITHAKEFYKSIAATREDSVP
eukprot:GEMP01026497.1.p1 GENE.GEMP01026497.1~~GEMP01026497.1.p1  ORF type:complete len:454 (+),score=90.77 GEMP01026497.1:60-1421(+)